MKLASLDNENGRYVGERCFFFTTDSVIHHFSFPFVHLAAILTIYMGWFFSFGTNASVLSCNNVGRCHFYRRLLACIPSLRAHDLARHRYRSWAVAPVRWVVGSQRSRKTVAMFSKQEQRMWNCWGWEVLYHPPPPFSRHQSLRLWSHPEDANAREALPYHWRR